MLFPITAPTFNAPMHREIVINTVTMSTHIRVNREDAKSKNFHRTLHLLHKRVDGGCCNVQIVIDLQSISDE